MASRCRSGSLMRPPGDGMCRGSMLKLCVIVVHIIILFAGPARAGVTGATCAVSSPSDLSKTYNAGQRITLHAGWTGDTPPFGATFKSGGSAIGTAYTSDGQADFSLSAAALADGEHNFTVSVIETSVPNSTSSPDAPAPGTVKIDHEAPVLTVSVVSGAVVSPATGHNEVVVQVTSSESLGGAPKLTVSPGTWAAPVPESPETPPYTNIRYTIAVPAGMSPGAYTVHAAGRDATEPAASSNEGRAQTAFTVDAAADGLVTITGSVPASPCRAESITVQGTAPAESQSQKIELLEGSTVVGTAQLAAGADTWSAVLATVAEGTHEYKARRVDPLGNVSAPGAAFTVIVDRTPPGRPVIDPPKNPVNTSSVRITGHGATDEPHRSGPVKVTLRRESTVIGTGIANADGSFSIDNVKLESGSNLILAQAADTTWDSSGNSAGNTSEFSAAVTIVLDQEAPTVIPGGVVISTPQTALAPAISANAPLTQPLVPSACMEAGPGVSPAPVPASLMTADGNPVSTAPETALLIEPVRTGFLPPLPGDENDRRLILPLAAVSDRSPEHVSVSLVYRRCDESPDCSHRRPMQLGGRGFETRLPMPGPGLYYRFQLVDRAGNVSWLPSTGEFCHRAVRSSLLRCVENAGRSPAPLDADEWPISSLGLPPRERLAAYRTIEVPAAAQTSVAALIDTLPDARKPRLICRDNLPVSDDSSWKADLEMVKAGKAGELPKARLDLLILDIRNGIISYDIISGLEDLSDSDAARQIGEAIRFRRLHDREGGK